MKEFWIDKSFISWDGVVESSLFGEIASLKRSWDLWEHAEEILDNHRSKEFLSDAISNLNRAIKYRVKALENDYHFKNSPFKSKDKNIYQQLEEVGILRHRLINEINLFRNNIEHNDKKPPELNKCLDFLEICWYFLRATDSYVQNINNSILITNPKNAKYWIEIGVYFEQEWLTTIRGWIKPVQFSSFEKKEFIRIVVGDWAPRTRQELISSFNTKQRKEFYDSEKYGGCGENPDDISFDGLLPPNENNHRDILKAYFRIH